MGVTVIGTTAYVHDSGEGLVTLNCSDPGEPVCDGVYYSPAIFDQGALRRHRCPGSGRGHLDLQAKVQRSKQCSRSIEPARTPARGPSGQCGDVGNVSLRHVDCILQRR